MTLHLSKHKKKGFAYLEECKDQHIFQEGFKAGMQLWYQQYTFLSQTSLKQLETPDYQKQYVELFNQNHFDRN